MNLPKIFITIDDGPDPIHTLEILSTLRQYKAKATFFWITQKAQELHDNNKDKFEEILYSINDEGHEIGYHGPADYMPTFKTRIWTHYKYSEFARGFEDLLRLTNKDIRYYRPHCLIQPINYFYAKKLGLKYILASPNGYINPEKMDFNGSINKMIKPNTVILLHGNYTLKRSLTNGENLLPLILSACEKKNIEAEILSHE